MQTQMIVIDNITIELTPDPDGADCLGRYSDKPGPADRTIDRKDRGDMRRSEFRYFIAGMSGTDTGNPESVEQDYQHAEACCRGEVSYWEVRAIASVSYSTLDRCRRIERLRSGGCCGVDDSGLDDVIADELEDLWDHLAVFGVELSNFDTLADAAKGRLNLV